MTTMSKEYKKSKSPAFKIEKSLNEYDEMVLFPEKLKKANQTLKKVGLPIKCTR